MCKIYVAGLGTFLDIGQLILRTFNLTFSADFQPYQLETRFPNPGAKHALLIAPPLTLTHPERCAAKFCARTCHKFLGISNIRPNRDHNIARKQSDKCRRVALSSIWVMIC